MIWLVLSALFYAVNNLLWKIFVKEEQPLHLIRQRAIYTSLFSIIILLLVEKDIVQYAAHPDFSTLMVGSVLGAIGLIFMVTFLKSGSLSLMGYYSFLGITITGTYTYLIKNEPLSSNVILGAGLLIVGYLLYLWDDQKSFKKDKVRLTQHALLVLMTVFFTTSTIVKWEIIGKLPTLVFLTVQEIVVLILSIVVFAIMPKHTHSKKRTFQTQAAYPLLAGVILIAVFFGLLGLSETNSFISSLTNVLIPVLTIIFGCVFMKEKISKLQFFAFLLIVSGELLLF